MLTGVYAARNITGERHDVWSVNTEKEYHEEGRVAQLNAGDRLVPTAVTIAVNESVGEPEDDMIEAAFARLDPLALGIAVGVVSGIGLWLAAVILVLNGGRQVGPTLSLLRNYLPGFEVTWIGAGIGLVEGGVVGFGFGYLGAVLRNGGLKAYALFVRWRHERDDRRHLLDKM